MFGLMEWVDLMVVMDNLPIPRTHQIKIFKSNNYSLKYLVNSISVMYLFYFLHSQIGSNYSPW